MAWFTDDAVWALVNEWRASHGFPLNTFQTNLRYRAKRADEHAVVAQRLKRLTSIINKLERETNMKLSQMQDIGGCRAIVRSASLVQRLADQYLDDGCRLRNNYILEPKSDGYRGVHVVGRYYSDDPEYADWNGHRVEIQLRTQLQHAWATALETVMTFTNEPLKFGGGDGKWRRFFALMGSALADRERTPLIPGAPLDKTELKELTGILRVVTRLEGWQKAMEFMPKKRVTNAEAYLLVLNPTTRRLQVTPYKHRETATLEVEKIEKKVKADDSRVDVVVVNADSLDELRRAYPNYYADTKEFLTAVRQAIN